MNTPLVSVIIPVYNASHYLAETLESVLGQSYRHWELIMVDDGSKDDSADIAREFIARTGRGELLSHPGGANRGSSATRNAGLRRATGELVCFLDSDDVWDPEFLSFFVEKFLNLPRLAMAYSPFLLWYSFAGDDGGTPRDTLQDLGVAGDRVVQGEELLRLYLESEDAVPSPSGVVFRRSALVEAGGWEDDFRGMYDDQVIYAKLFARGASVYLSQRSMYRYRQHPGSLCRQAVRENRIHESRKRYLGWLGEHLGAKGKLSPELGRTIKEQQWRVWLSEGLSRMAELRKEKDPFLYLRLARYALNQTVSRAFFNFSVGGWTLISEESLLALEFLVPVEYLAPVKYLPQLEYLARM